MDEFNFDNVNDLTKDNFYSDDLEHLNIFGKDGNGNSATYTSQEYYFDSPDSHEDENNIDYY